ncbi:MAG: hypothetical protein KGZ80_05150 [Methylomonas sp.]|nr:hypothetical protein [Methylomonas sp.]PPD20127.1 MAG: hypothetical protein CTY23_09865 [Methylomonas sp.]PPD25154.1 MAG: hypothetical protein CTY22_09535 [Methylomonas sp.]PPD34660.1 MAG: hypothetical protein CTY21_09640 [Methylomonas sp.]PPD52144.1 MAG: hypothetical protein CTY11_09885 [Methylomonas sp.]
MTALNHSSQILSHDTLAQWLAKLGTLSVAHAAHRLVQLLKQLKPQADSDPALQLQLLLGLIPAVIRIIYNLNSVVNQAGQDEKTHKLSRLCVQLPRQLGLNFSLWAESGRLDASQMPLAIYHALQALGHADYYYALDHQPPSETLWKKTAALYRRAEAYRQHRYDLGNLVAEYQGQATIDAVVKRNVLFALLQPARFDDDRIKALFLFAGCHGDDVDFSSSPSTANPLFAWDLQGAQPPVAVKHTLKTLPDGYLGIDTSRLGQALADNTTAMALGVEFRNRLRHHLAGYRDIFASVVPVKPQATYFVQGFDEVCACLQQRDKLTRIKQMGGQDAHPLLARREIALMPMEHERHAFHALAEQSRPSQRAPGRRVHKMRIESERYVLIEGYSFDCVIGEIALICDDDTPPVLVVVRQQAYHDPTGAMHVLLEKMPGDCGIYAIAPKADNRKAIVLNETMPYAEVVLASGRYDRQGRIALINDKIIVLGDFLEASSRFARYRFSFDW